MDRWTRQHHDALEGGDGLEASLVELVVAVSECTEDESEIFDRMDGLLASGRVRIRRAA